MNTLKRTGLAIKAGAVASWEAAKKTFSLTDDAGESFGYAYRRKMWSWGGWGYRRLARLAMSNPHARSGLRLISQNAAGVPLQVQKRSGNEWQAMEGEAKRLTLFERPNDRTTRMRFFKKMIVALHCGGEFFLEKRGPSTGPNAGEARSLRTILPDEFAGFQRDRETGEVSGYRFTRRNRYGTDGYSRSGYRSGEVYTRSTDEVLHVRLFNPTRPERGLPILVAGLALQQMEAAQEWNTNIAKGGGRVPGYWVPNAKAFNAKSGQAPVLSPEQIQEAQDDFDERSQERAAANLDMFLTGAFERQQGDISPKDADWLEGQKLAIRQIATLLGVPPTLLGDEKAGSLTDSGVDSEVRALMLLTVLPMLEWLLAEISAFVLPAGMRFYYDRDQIESLQEDVNAIWKRASDAYALGIIDRDEARAMVGYEEEGSSGQAEDGGAAQEEEVGEGAADGVTRNAPQLDPGALLDGTGVEMQGVEEALRSRFGEG